MITIDVFDFDISDVTLKDDANPFWIRKGFIEELKEKSNSNKNLYFVTTKSQLSLNLNIKDIAKYSHYFYSWRSVCFKADESISINDQTKIISELPKDVCYIHHIIDKLSNALTSKEYLSTLIEFDKFQIKNYAFEIYLLKDGWTKDQTISETNFRVKDIYTNLAQIMSNSELLLKIECNDKEFWINIIRLFYLYALQIIIFSNNNKQLF